MNSEKSNCKIGFLLADISLFCLSSGGPVVRWVYEVTSRIEGDNFLTLSHKNLVSDDNLGDYKISVGFFEKIIKKSKTFFKRSSKFKSWTWCVSHYIKIKKCKIVIVENRPHYCLILRKIGYKGIVVLHMHNDFLSNYSINYLKNLDRVIDYTIFCSNYIREKALGRETGLFLKSEVIYNGVDSLKFNAVEDNKAKVIFFWGRIVEQKGVHVLLNAFKQILKDIPDTELWIAGSSSFGKRFGITDYEKQLVLNADRIDKSKIKFLGFLSHEELPEYISRATVACLPSIRMEAFPFSVLEAMSCGTVVVASKVGGVPEAIEHEHCLVRENDPKELASKITDLLNNDELRKNIEKENRLKVQKEFNWDKIADQFQEIIYKVNSLESTTHS